MAKYPVKCERCGKDHTVELFGKEKIRMLKLGVNSYDELPVPHGLCSECEEKRKQEENQKAAEENKEKGLPELQGTEKQIAYAEKLRNEEIERTKNHIEKLKTLKEGDDMDEKINTKIDKAQEEIKLLQTETNAGKVIAEVLNR